MLCNLRLGGFPELFAPISRANTCREVAVALKRSGLHDSKLAIGACALLGKLAHLMGNQQALQTADALHAVIDVLKETGAHNADVAYVFCFAVSEFAKHTANRDQLIVIGAASAVADCMQNGFKTQVLASL